MKILVLDIGKKATHVFVPETNNYYKIEHSDFIKLNIPELEDGDTLVVEEAHMRAQSDNSLAQAFKIDDLHQFKILADSKNNPILLFPQKVTPKARKVASLVYPELIEKTDLNDIKSIAYYIQHFPSALKTLKKFAPISYEEFVEKNSHIFNERIILNDDINEARNESYGIKTDYSDAVTNWIKKYMSILAYRLSNETREWVGLELNAKGNALKPGLLNYTSEKLKFVYTIVNTILNPKTGTPRLRSDYKVPPFWKYAKAYYFGLTPYHMKAGVTASNYKWHKRKASTNCKISMSLDSKQNPIKTNNDVFEIRKEMISSDKKLQEVWREVRKMIVEEGLR